MPFNYEFNFFNRRRTIQIFLHFLGPDSQISWVFQENLIPSRLSNFFGLSLFIIVLYYCLMSVAGLVIHSLSFIIVVICVFLDFLRGKADWGLINFNYLFKRKVFGFSFFFYFCGFCLIGFLLLCLSVPLFHLHFVYSFYFVTF